MTREIKFRINFLPVGYWESKHRNTIVNECRRILRSSEALYTLFPWFAYACCRKVWCFLPSAGITLVRPTKACLQENKQMYVQDTLGLLSFNGANHRISATSASAHWSSVAPRSVRTRAFALRTLRAVWAHSQSIE